MGRRNALIDWMKSPLMFNVDHTHHLHRLEMARSEEVQKEMRLLLNQPPSASLG